MPTAFGPKLCSERVSGTFVDLIMFAIDEPGDVKAVSDPAPWTPCRTEESRPLGAVLSQAPVNSPGDRTRVGGSAVSQHLRTDLIWK